MTRQDELWKEDTGGTIRCHHCDWTGQADTIADAIALVRRHYDDAHDGAPAVQRALQIDGPPPE